MVASVLLALPTVFDTRLAILVPVVGVTVAVACDSKWAIPSVAISFLLALLLALQPHGTDLLNLEIRYSDSFSYLSEDTYYARRLGQAVRYSRVYGSTYYSQLYEDIIIEEVKHYFPEDTEFGDIRVTAVQTDKVYFGWNPFYQDVRPEVYVQAKVPEDNLNWTIHGLPENITMEVIL